MARLLISILLFNAYNTKQHKVISAIQQAFSQCDKQAALITFMTAGFPKLDSTPAMLRAMTDAGADILEVGVPFSDPMADGVAIQQAGATALAQGMTLPLTLQSVADFRRQSSRQPPVVLMGYANSFINHAGGAAGFAAAAADAGVNGLIVVDLADSVRAEWKTHLNQFGLDMISLVSPTTSAARLQQLAAAAQGFVYAISLKGITGAAHINAAAIKDYLLAVRESASVPVAAGFGVRTPKQAKELAACADGVVVGSMLIEAAAQAADSAVDAVMAAVSDLAVALKTAK